MNRRFETSARSFMQIDYIKTSSFLLLPQMFSGTQLDDLRLAMDSLQQVALDSMNRQFRKLELENKQLKTVDKKTESNNRLSIFFLLALIVAIICLAFR